MTETKYKTLTIRLSKNIYNKLQKHAEKNYRSKSKDVGYCLNKFYELERKGKI